jgi:hypothetical protein
VHAAGIVPPRPETHVNRKKIMLRSFVPSLCGAVAALALPAAFADDVHCLSTIGAVGIDGNVLVAAPCRLEGTRVGGNVLLYTGGSLVATDARIDGNIQAENADFIDVLNVRVDGDIQLDDMVGDRSRIDRSRIDGNIQLKDNRSRLEVLGNEVGGDVQLFDNAGGAAIVGNVIGGNLQCKDNRPAPAGGGNRVEGNREDQCAALQPESADSSLSLSAGSAAAAPGGGGALDGAGLLLLALGWVARRRGAGG